MRYLKLYGHFVATSFMGEMMYRRGFWLSVLARVAWFLFFVAFYSLLYGQITQIATWGYWDTMLLLATFFLLETILYLLFIKNFSNLPHMIADGDLDLWLIKPVDAQFVLSLRHTSFTSFLNLLPPLFLLVLAFIKLGLSFSWASLGMILAAFVIALIIAYSIWLMIMTLAFWLGRVDVLHEAFLSLFRFLQFPTVIYSGAVLLFLTYVLPIIFIVTIPLASLRGSLTWPNFLLGLSLAVLLFIVSRLFWLFAIRYYSSASS